MKIIVSFLSLFMLFGFSSLYAENNTVTGYWKTIDDESGKVRSIVKIWKENGTLKGVIEETFPEPGEDIDPVCDKCSGDKKDKPVKGMIFLWGFEKSSDKWKKGSILDPDNGKIYKCELKLSDQGDKLEVYGYIRVIVKIGRSQTWIRHI